MTCTISRLGNAFVALIESTHLISELIEKNIVHERVSYQQRIHGYYGKHYRLVKRCRKPNTVIIPRFLVEPLPKNEIDLSLCTSWIQQIEKSMNGFKFHKSQVAVLKEVIEYILTWNGMCLNLPTGYGKTIIAIAMIAILSRFVKKGCTVLIIVNRLSTRDQWCKKVKEMIGEEVAIVGKSKEPHRINISVVNSLVNMITTNTLPIKKVDFLIVDEVHNMAAPCFNKTIQKITTDYSLGLSATMERTDGLEKLFWAYLGHIVTPNVQVTKPKVRYIQLICENNDDNILQTTVAMIHSIISRGRQVIVFAKVIKLLEMFEKEWIKVNKLKPAICYGGQSKATYKSSGNGVVLATYSMGAESIDIVDLDTVVFLEFSSNESRTKQAIGRITRNLECNNNSIPKTVIDVGHRIPSSRLTHIKKCVDVVEYRKKIA